MNIGIVISHLGSSQISFYTIKAINKLIAERYKEDITLFFEQLTPPVIHPRCSMMCLNELMSFSGTFITSTIDNTIMTAARNSKTTNKIVYYVWDLEWMRQGKNIYLYNLQAFNGAHRIIARSENHKKAIENYSNKKVDLVLEDFNIKELIKW